MEKIQFICAYLFICIFFIAFKEATLEIKNSSKRSNIIFIPVGKNSDKILKFNRLRHKSYVDTYTNRKEYNNMKRTGRSNREPKLWDQWGNWSTCSVTCGIGKIIRWRHCIGGNCSLGEKKAQLRTCTSAAC